MDRNYQANAVDQILPGSLSARRAWIEIGLFGVDTVSHQVALRKESVDRNIHAQHLSVCVISRSPQGERG